MDQLEQLKSKYASVIDTAKQHGVVLSHVNMQDNKLLIQGAAPNEASKNAVWNQVKAIDPGFADLTCDLSIDSSLPQPAAAAAAAPSGGGQKYTVKAGDTLGKISQQFYGSANHYMKIAEANGIDNPNLIQAGQELEIPAA